MSTTLMKIGHLSIQGEKSGKTITSVVQKLAGKEGYVLALLNINEKSETSAIITDIIREQLERASLTIGASNNLQHRFEQLLESINERIFKVFEDGAHNFDQENINGIIAVADESRVFLSGAGEMVTIFIHKEDGQHYRIYDLFRGIKSETSQPTPEKTFSVILDGTIEGNDVFFVATSNLFDDVPKEELQDIITTLPPAGAVERIRQFFPADPDLGVIVLKIEPVDFTYAEIPNLRAGAKAGAGAGAGAARSMSEFDQRIARTRRVMDDGKIDTSKFKFILSLTLDTLKILFATVKVALAMFTSLMLFLWRFVLKFLKTDKKQIIKDSGDKVLYKFNSLPQMNKNLFLALLAIAFIVIVVVTVNQFRTRAKEAEQTFKAEIYKVERLRDQAEGSMIYKDEDQARSYLIQARETLESVPATNAKNKKSIADLRQEIEADLSQLRHMVIIDAPAILAQIESPAMLAMTNVNDGVLIFGDDKNIYRLNEEGKTLDKINASGQIEGLVRATSFDEDKNILYIMDDAQKVYSLNLADNILEQINISLIQDSNPVDISFFAQRIYTLSPSADQIFKHSRVGSGFDGGSSWLNTKNTSLSNAVSFAFDGNIYALKKDGGIAKFFGGNEEAWKTPSIDPPMSGEGEIITSEDTKYLYIAQKETGRIVVLEKETGKLITQYSSAVFTDIKNIVVNERMKKILVLDGTRIYGVGAAHLD